MFAGIPWIHPWGGVKLKRGGRTRNRFATIARQAVHFVVKTDKRGVVDMEFLLIPITIVLAFLGLWLGTADQALREQYRSIAEQAVHANDAALVESRNAFHYQTMFNSANAECIFVATNKDTGKTYRVDVTGGKVVKQEEIPLSEVQILKIKSDEKPGL